MLTQFEQLPLGKIHQRRHFIRAPREIVNAECVYGYGAYPEFEAYF